MSSPQTITNTLLQWCTDNDVWIDPRLRIRCDTTTGIAVYAENASIPPNTSLVHIHRSSVLSVRNSSLSDVIEPVISGPAAQLSLSLALYAELLKGENSRWFGYLQSLPLAPVPLPLLWSSEFSNHDDLEDGNEGLHWLKGTEVERHYVQRPDQNLESIDAYYSTVAEPLLIRHFEANDTTWTTKPSINGFRHAYTLVSSRAFLVDAYHGLSMVPIADAFNHSQENHVHLETEFHVCPECGSLLECQHDADASENEKAMPRRLQGKVAHPREESDFDSYYEMVSNAPISPHEEVFNTYGETLTNTQLLAQYGFVLDVNENDCLHWDFQEVYTCCAAFAGVSISSRLEVESVRSAAIQSVARQRALERIADSSLVYLHADMSDSSLCVDADGRISHQLWILLALPFCLQGDRVGLVDSPGDITAHLEALLESQLALENTGEMNSDEDNDYQLSPSDGPILEGLARSLINLCAARKSRLGKDPSDSRNLNDILDALPSGMRRTRDALTIVIGEQSMLDSCISSWEDIVQQLSE
ncbi:putative saccharomyces cerevisiae YBR030w [Lyophyllum shimeji]|uniref:Saccharomyces cerevisiae YBR030w n=1 Tax=Lyophyllum shimeji TaxID=47721 RepID=A0A9P3PKB2_LYOSH|nr:putative saccharomyces cerevisiae YBR030w [Lyophyllum shimeji]